MHPAVYRAYAGCGDVCCIFFFLACEFVSTGHAALRCVLVWTTLSSQLHFGKLCISQAASTLQWCTSRHAISAAVHENGCVYSYVVNLCCRGYIFSSLETLV